MPKNTKSKANTRSLKSIGRYKFVKRDKPLLLKSKKTSSKEKKSKPKRSRAYMYSEAFGYLPIEFLDPRYNYEMLEDDVLTHDDGTPVIYRPNAILNLNAIEEHLREVLPKGTYFAIMVHDREIEEYDDSDNVPNAVLPHIHISIYYPYGKTVSAVRKDLGLYDSSKEKFIENFNKNGNVNNNNKVKKSLFSYLPHWTDAARGEKIDYGDYLTNHDKCRANFDLKKYVEMVSENMKARDLDIDEVVNDILDGNIIEYDFHKSGEMTQDERVLRTFYTKHKTAIDNAIKQRAKILATSKSEDDMTIFYFQGEAGAGKTQGAIQFAEKNFKHYYVSGGDKDPLQNYMGQECLILDDARPSLFNASDWLKLLDPFSTNASVNSRYFNKSLNAKCIIITTTIPFEEFFVYAKQKGGGKDAEEPVQQFIRRFTAVVEFVESKRLSELLDNRQSGTRVHCSDKKNFRIPINERPTKYIENRMKNYTSSIVFLDNICDFDPFYDSNFNDRQRHIIEKDKKQREKDKESLDYDVEYFKKENDIEHVLDEYDDYTIGRVFAVEKITDSKSLNEIKVHKKDKNGNVDDFKYTVNRKLVEQVEFMIVKLFDDNCKNKLDVFNF
ncbi:hypothetical protein M3D72_012570 [Staphylococcus epidermidis]|nr:hypothetical protein [Staphylococcus epidermidis]